MIIKDLNENDTTLALKDNDINQFRLGMREALARKKTEGVKLGRPKGSKSSYYKLSGKEDTIIKMLNKKISKVKIAKKLGVNRNTLYNFIKNNIDLF